MAGGNYILKYGENLLRVQQSGCGDCTYFILSITKSFYLPTPLYHTVGVRSSVLLIPIISAGLFIDMLY